MTESQKAASQIKLTQNENAFGASPKALQVIKHSYPSVFRYPDVFNVELKQKLADKYDVEPSNIAIGAGSIALMDMAIKAFVGDGQNVVTAKATFEGYKYMAKVNAREFRLAELVDNRIDLPNLLELCDDSTRIVFIANPNNPTGTMVTHDEVEAFLKAVSSDTYVVLDEAYAEYITSDKYPRGLELLKTYPNLIIFRTFSKIYGLAGLRIGYSIATESCTSGLMQHWTPFSINGLAAAAASAALDDVEYVAKCVISNTEEREFLYKELLNLGYSAVAPEGNFIFVEFDSEDKMNNFYDRLFDADILIRKLGPFGVDLGLRISVGKPAENRKLIAVLKSQYS